MAGKGNRVMGEEAKKADMGKLKAAAQEKSKEDGGKENPKDLKEKKKAPPPPPEEVEMRVYMHCEACAKKVKKVLKNFDGVEDVFADSKTYKVVVKGKKVAADPMRVVERVQKKTGRRVELVSPLPPMSEEQKEEEKEEEPEPPKPEEKEEPPVITVVLKMHIHCEACANWIKKRIITMKGVLSAEPDQQAKVVTVTGTFEESKLAQFIYRRTGKHTAIIKSEVVTPPGSTGDNNKAKEEEKAMEGGEANQGGGNTASGEENGNQEENNAATVAVAANNMYMYYPQYGYYSNGYYPNGYSNGYYSNGYYPPQSGYYYQPSYSSYYSPYVPHHQMMAPQIFSDENPHACSVM